METRHHYTGLSAQEVEASRKEHGENVLTPPAKKPIWLQFLDKFKIHLSSSLSLLECFRLAFRSTST